MLLLIQLLPDQRRMHSLQSRKQVEFPTPNLINPIYLYPCNSYIPPKRFFENFGNYHQLAAAGWKEWDATESAQMWYDGAIANEGMVLPQRIGFAKGSSRLTRDKFPP